MFDGIETGEIGAEVEGTKSEEREGGGGGERKCERN